MAELKVVGRGAGRRTTHAAVGLAELPWEALANRFSLTPRQCELARLVCAGLTYRAVAMHMGISINTVRMHIRFLFERLNAHDRLTVLLRILEAANVLQFPKVRPPQRALGGPA